MPLADPKDRKGFTLVELLVSMTILIIITVAVTTDISISRQQEELASNVRFVRSMVRDVQSRAQSATSLNTCDNGTNIAVCELDTANCGAGACDTQIVPNRQGLRFSTTHPDYFIHFAEVDPLLVNAQYDGDEEVQRIFLQSTRSSVIRVEVADLMIDGSQSVDTVDITFNRQSGHMQFEDPLGVTGNLLGITLTHRETGRSEVVSLNAVTGKITIE
ncbi:prepilin-type N-terminal cleavage/methylation domain-containing protein [Candidatus Uhrbacteria bacterium]|nr:prepilin-type N-terminal cleavage/methylation domain-containing protein [Candidatus Uhrbacteria bacterium]MBD3284665.1 prepilin-type N-terminal cleavage/methylation domain-containing protein [Candidatus Uhrbacteria bacterium]